MKHALPCSAIRDLLAVSQPEIDLSYAEYTALQNHLKSCPTCQATRKQYMLLAERLQAASTQIAYTTPAEQDALASGASISLRDAITEDATEIDTSNQSELSSTEDATEMDTSNQSELSSAHTLEFPQRFLYRDEIQERDEVSAVSDTAMSRSSLERGEERAMCCIDMRVLCSDRFSEVLISDVEQTELTIESIVGTALLEVFDIVHVKNVTVHHSPERDSRMVSERRTGDQ